MNIYSHNLTDEQIKQCQHSEALEQNIRIALLALENQPIGQEFVAGVLRDVLMEVAKGICFEGAEYYKRNHRARVVLGVKPPPCGVCIVCIAKKGGC
jgi:hypothetical protein